MPGLDGRRGRRTANLRRAVAADKVENLGLHRVDRHADRGITQPARPQTTFAWTNAGTLFDMVRDATIAAERREHRA